MPYRNVVLRILIGLATACLVAVAVQAGPMDVPMATFTVSDQDGNSISSDLLKQTEPWVLVVVTTNQKSSIELLAKLQRKEGDWANRITVVVSGNQSDFTQIIQQNSKLTNVRWYRDADGSIMRNLNLSGWPALLGIIPGDFIGWRSVGVPAKAVEAQSLVSSWIGTTASPQ